MIAELDSVRVVRLLEPKAPEGSAKMVRQPRVGDTGTVVGIRETARGDRIYTVECVNREGLTEWLVGFWRGEIERMAE